MPSKKFDTVEECFVYITEYPLKKGEEYTIKYNSDGTYQAVHCYTINRR